MRNLLVELCYDGSAYHGWQVQKNALTIQEVFRVPQKGYSAQGRILRAAAERTAGFMQIHILSALKRIKISLRTRLLRH